MPRQRLVRGKTAQIVPRSLPSATLPLPAECLRRHLHYAPTPQSQRLGQSRSVSAMRDFIAPSICCDELKFGNPRRFQAFTAFRTACSVLASSRADFASARRRGLLHGVAFKSRLNNRSPAARDPFAMPEYEIPRPGWVGPLPQPVGETYGPRCPRGTPRHRLH